MLSFFVAGPDMVAAVGIQRVFSERVWRVPADQETRGRTTEADVQYREYRLERPRGMDVRLISPGNGAPRDVDGKRWDAKRRQIKVARVHGPHGHVTG